MSGAAVATTSPARPLYPRLLTTDRVAQLVGLGPVEDISDLTILSFSGSRLFVGLRDKAFEPKTDNGPEEKSDAVQYDRERVNERVAVGDKIKYRIRSKPYQDR